MADSDVQVRIGAEASDLQAKIALAKAELAALNAETKALATQMTATGQAANTTLRSALSDSASEAVQAAARLKELTHATDGVANLAKGSGASLSFFAREARAMADEIASGRMRQFDGTLVNVAVHGAQAAAGWVAANPVLAALGVAAAAAAAAIGYLAYETISFGNAASQVELGAAINQIAMTDEQAQKLTDTIAKTADVSYKEAAKIAQAFQQLGPAATPLAEAVSTYLPLFAKEMGEDAPKAAQKLSAMFVDLSTKGRQYLAETNGVTAGQIQQYDAFVQAGEKGQAYAMIVEAMASRLDGYRAHLAETKAAQDANAQSVQALGDVDVSLFNGINNTSDALAQERAKLAESSAALGQYAAQLRTATAEQDQFNAALRESAKINVNATELTNAQNQLALLQAGLGEATKRGDTAGVASISSAIDRLNDKMAVMKQRVGDGLLGRDAIGQTEADLHRIDNAWSGSAIGRLQAERQVIEQTLNGETLSAAQREKLQEDLAAKDHQIAEEVRRTRQAQDNLDLASANKNTAEKIAIRQREYREAVATYGAESREAIEAQARVVEAQNAAANAGAKSARQGARDALAEQIRGYDDQVKAAQKAYEDTVKLDTLKVKAKQITEAQAIADEKQALGQAYDAEREALTKELALEDLKPAKRKEINDKLLALDKERAEKEAELNQKAIEQQNRDMQTVFGPINSAFNGQISGMIRGTETFRQAMANMAASAIENFAQIIAKAIETRIEVALLGSIPGIGSIIGSVSSLLVPAFAEGTDEVQSTGLALIHRGEMIVPAAPAQQIRAMANGGGVSSNAALGAAAAASARGSGGDTNHNYGGFNFSISGARSPQDVVSEVNRNLDAITRRVSANMTANPSNRPGY